jgi:predicted tellurium resistance membrane protein TerC
MWISLISLTSLEIILGIDNIIFIALLVQHLPAKQKILARNIAIFLALLIRIILLFGIAWIMGLTEPFANILGHEFSGKDIMMLAGGIFLIYKSTSHVHEMFAGEKQEEYQGKKLSMAGTIFQALLIDLVFSFDSVITAVGITENIPVIIVAMVISMIFMLFSVKKVSSFINDYPSLKTLALSFIMLIGVLLVAEGFHMHIPRGYVYFAMAFSVFVEIININVGKRRMKAVQKAKVK